MTRLLIFGGLLIGSCGYALLRGGAPERIVGAALLAAAAASALSFSELPIRFFHLEFGVLLVDLVLLGVLVAVALFADRGWPLLLAGLQLSAIGAHVIKTFDWNMIRVTYAVAIAMWSYPMLIALAIGTWRHRQRLKAQGYDVAWSVGEKLHWEEDPSIRPGS
jgi:hypothetical protein